MKKIFFRLTILLLLLQGILMSAIVKHINIKGIDVPIIFEKDKNLPILNLQLVFINSGSLKDKDKAGLSSISAELLNEGTKKLGVTKFAQKLEDNAISLSANNALETFIIELSSIKDVQDKAFKYLKELLQDPNYDNKTLNKIKTLRVGALKEKENDFDYIANRNLKKILFEGDISQQSIDSISKINLKNVKNFLSKTLDLNNLIIVVGGDISYDDIIKKLEDIVSVLNNKSKSRAVDVTISNKKEVKTVLKNTQQAYIYFGSPFNAKAKDEDIYMVSVASYILGGGSFRSRLMDEIRVKRGLAYSVYGDISVNKSFSYFKGYLQTKLETANEAKELISKEIRKFIQEGVSQEELDSAKKFLLGSEPLRIETLSQRLSRAFILYYKGLKQDYPKKYLEKIENLKLVDLNKYIKSHKEIDNLSFSIVRK